MNDFDYREQKKGYIMDESYNGEEKGYIMDDFDGEEKGYVMDDFDGEEIGYVMDDFDDFDNRVLVTAFKCFAVIFVIWLVFVIVYIF